MNTFKRGFLIAVIVIIVIAAFALLPLYTNWIWFKDLGYSAIFSRLLYTKLILFLVSAAAFFAIVSINLVIARKIAPPSDRLVYADEFRQRMAAYAQRGLGALVTAGAAAVAIMVGLSTAGHWDDLLRFLYGGSFGWKDPVFGRDLGFYVFQLPFIRYIYGWLFFALVISGIAVGVMYYMGQAIEFLANIPRFAPRVKSHIFTIIALLFLLRVWGYWLDRYGLLFGGGDVIPGPGYADLHGRLPALYILMAASILAAVLTMMSIRRRGITHVVAGFVIVIGVSFVGGVLYPGMLERFVVKPNQLIKETPYITNGIKFTREAYGLSKVERRTYTVENKLSASDIGANETTIQNVRLWDYEPLLSTYKQMQELQQYYEFTDVDIDRYTIDGDYRQVMLSARELDQTALSASAQNWLNTHLVYTHGYGLAMSPVNEVNPEGLPIYFMKDIPAVSTVDVKVTQPRIYFGEMTTSYAMVKTKNPEFDYPFGDTDVQTTYKADRGIHISGRFTKLLFAARLGDMSMAITPNLTRDSRLLYRRKIGDRLSTLFPFLRFDNDPYLVVSGGRMLWIQDAYTISSQFPYSQRQRIEFNYAVFGDVFNYIRNSVKITVDAYTGDVVAYYDDKDPIIRAYSRAFKGVFRPFSKMPKDIRAHVRYPEDMFSAQTLIYNTYHMTKPRDFFYKTDLWAVPQWQEVGGAAEMRSVEPYYLIMRLPGEKREEFILLRPATRANKDNMVAWVCAKCDPEDYGKLIVFTFGQGQLIYGPKQVEARANQNPYISKELSLWRSGGSNVILGNLLAIPMETSILYVQPLYLEATGGETKIPQFTRVIVALGDKVVMEKTLAEALAGVIGGPVPSVPTTAERPSQAAGRPAPPTAPSPPGDTTQLIRQAGEQFRRAREAQQRDDWAAYGEELKRLERTLTELRMKTESNQ